MTDQMASPGSGYFVVTPDTNRLSVTNSSNSTYCPTNASWLPYHPMYVPVFQGQMAGMAVSRAHMRNISCQVCIGYAFKAVITFL